jgi:hypothetical protein
MATRLVVGFAAAVLGTVLSLGMGPGCSASSGGDTLGTGNAAAVGGAAAHGAGAPGGGGTGGFGFGGTGAQGGSNPCPPPPNPAGSEVALAAEYAGLYAAYLLGPVPGVPDPLGGCVIKYDDPNTLWIAGGSEHPEGQIYSIGVERDACGHIIGFQGTAQLVAQTPYVDANLVYGPAHLLLYTQWPEYKISQLPDGASASALDTDLLALGIPNVGDQGPGGIGFVPPSLPAAGELRIVTWPAGLWYHVAATLGGNGLYDITAISQHGQLANGPGGFAYVPAGSPGFAAQSLIISEWSPTDLSQDRVTTYEVDDQGDPALGTRKEFFTKFPRPWGAYFEPLTGDFLFLTWGAAPPDRVYIVQGFVPPPPPPS